jgi:hypothetical protein
LELPVDLKQPQQVEIQDRNRHLLLVVFYCVKRCQQSVPRRSSLGIPTELHEGAVAFALPALEIN